MRLVFFVVTFLPGMMLLPAEVKLAGIFGDHMVVQEGAKLPVWGTAAAGEAVEVTLGGESARATADAGGDWRVDLPPLPVDGQPLTLTVKGSNTTVSFTDVLVGEVWVCSGQSNMAMPLADTVDGHKDISSAADPQLRLFLVAQKTSLEPMKDLQGEWKLCTPADIPAFSAVGYYFGHELRQQLNRPVGLIGCYWGGTPAEAWVSLPALQAKPALQNYVDKYQKTKVNYATASAGYAAQQQQYEKALAAWQQGPEGVEYNAREKAWRAVMMDPTHQGHPDVPEPVPPPGAPRPPPPPDGGPFEPTTLFNGMIAPLIPYAIKGVVWYQGEGNASRGYEYRTLFPTLIQDWRERWNLGDFPFLYVQIAGYNAGPVQCWPYLREAQMLTLSLPNTGMATAIDIGNPGYVHPQDKKDVGHRLALWARQIAYHEDVPASGPIYQAMIVKGAQIQVSFTHADGGLTIGQAPWVAPGIEPLPTDKLAGFTIAGADKRWMPANAQIQDNTVLVSNPAVTAPVAVRYDWANSPRGNLYNKADLPASSFRTDDWPDPAMGPVAAGSDTKEPSAPAAH